MRVLIIALLIGIITCDEPVKPELLEKLENVNIQEVVKDPLVMKTVFDCLTDQKPCGDMQYLRDSVPALIASKCNECNNKQKAKFSELNSVLQEKYPVEFKNLLQKFSSNQIQ